MTIEEVRKIQYKTGTDLLKSVEINPIESCNRSCSFCPRSDKKKYPTTGNKISEDTCKKISDDLIEIGFENRVGFVGFGEPLLHNNLEKCVEIFRSKIPKLKWLEINTNGDFLTKDRISSLKDSGCNLLSVSMYDKDISDKIKEMNTCGIEIVFRHHYEKENNYGLRIVDRKNIAYGSIDYNIKSECYIPFYKLFIDWNGEIITCQNDWFRYQIFGNINRSSIKTILSSEKMIEFKKLLMVGDRSKTDPCKKCNIDGKVMGEQEFNEFKRHHSS